MISIERVKLWESTLTIYIRVKTVHILDPDIPLPGINPENIHPRRNVKECMLQHFIIENVKTIKFPLISE